MWCFFVDLISNAFVTKKSYKQLKILSTCLSKYNIILAQENIVAIYISQISQQIGM
jgi:hypothetical protein